MSRAVPVLAIVAAGAIAIVIGTALVSAEPAVVQSDGQCLRMREAPSLTAAVLTCIPDGSTVEALADTAEVDGYAWRNVLVGDRQGWVASTFLQTVSVPSAGPSAFPTPPTGGLTAGVAGTDSLKALLAAQPFEVASVAAFDVVSQQFLTYLPGAPDFANTLNDGSLDPSAVVLIRRVGTFEPGQTPIASVQRLSGMPSALLTPDRGELTAGLAGTNEVNGLIAAQPFAVESIAAWDVSAQRWLVHIAGAPSIVNTLGSRLSADMPVFLLRSANLPDPSIPVSEVQDGTGRPVERITYYYCERGENPAGWGDGGGFCGFMRSGATVYEGAASCAPEYFGTRFRIDGDPTERVYTCEDTGGGVGSGHRDVWFNDSDDAYAWWRQVGPTAEVILVD